MKKILLAIIVIFLCGSEATFALNESEVYEKVKDATFMIYAFNGKNKKPVNMAQGSAVAVSSKVLLTNCHVTKDNKYILIKKGENYINGFLVYANKKIDLCMIFVPEAAFNAVTIRSSDTLKIGERVFAIGSPKGKENIISEGIIAGIRQIKGNFYISTNAKIDKGSSGGGLFDQDANLIGLTMGHLRQVTLAIPLNWMIELIPLVKRSE